MTRICVTGAGGFVGHHFLEHVLATTDWDVACTDSFRHRGKTDRITQVLDAHPDWKSRTDVITHDLTAPFSNQAALRLMSASASHPGGLDFLVAMASESHVDRSISQPVPFVTNNVAVILNTLELARRLAPRAVVVVSTDEVYGPEVDGIAHPEWDTIVPSNPYSGSKAAQEAIAISYWRTYGVPVIIVNCMNLIGERQDPEKYLPSLISSTLAGATVTVHGTEGNVGTRHYLHSRNLADGILFLLSRGHPSMFPAHSRPGEPVGDRPDRYNIAGPDRISNLELAGMVADILGRPLRYRLKDFHTARPGHDPHYGLDSGKITSLGWKPPVPFGESLERTVRWTMEHPEWLALKKQEQPRKPSFITGRRLSRAGPAGRARWSSGRAGKPSAPRLQDQWKTTTCATTGSNDAL